jgi:hypothetical protein
MRSWSVTLFKNGNVGASFTLSKDGYANFGSRNKVDYKKYVDMMSDEVKFRAMFTNKKALDEYEEYIENGEMED